VTDCFYTSPAEKAATTNADEAINRAANVYPTLGLSGFRDFAAEDRRGPTKQDDCLKKARRARVNLRNSTRLVSEIQQIFGPFFAAQQQPVSLESVQHAVDWSIGFVVPNGAIIVAAFAAGLAPELRKDGKGRVIFTGRLLPITAAEAPAGD
jgi:hypothetical protein